MERACLFELDNIFLDSVPASHLNIRQESETIHKHEPQKTEETYPNNNKKNIEENEHVIEKCSSISIQPCIQQLCKLLFAS